MVRALRLLSKAPTGAIHRTQVGVGRLVIGEPHRLVVPTERFTGETNGNKPKHRHLCEWTAVIKVRARLTARANRLDPIPGVSFDPRDFLRRRVFARVLLHEVLRKKVAVGATVGTVHNHSLVAKKNGPGAGKLFVG